MIQRVGAKKHVVLMDTPQHVPNHDQESLKIVYHLLNGKTRCFFVRAGLLEAA